MKKYKLTIIFLFLFSVAFSQIKEVRERYYVLDKNMIERRTRAFVRELIFDSFYNTFTKPFKAGSILSKRIEETIYKFKNKKLYSTEIKDSIKGNKIFFYEYIDNQLSKVKRENGDLIYKIKITETEESKIAEIIGDFGLQTFVFENKEDIHPSCAFTSNNGTFFYRYDQSLRELNMTTGNPKYNSKFIYNEFNDLIIVKNYFGSNISIKYDYDSRNNWIKKTLTIEEEGENQTVVFKRSIKYNTVKKEKQNNSGLFIIGKTIDNSEKYGFIDKEGKIVINPQFDRAYGFNDGLAQVRVGGKYGYIDKKGKIVINPQFDYTYEYGFKNGLALVKVGGKYGYIDKEGKIVINPQFDRAYSFNDGLAQVKVGEKWGYIDKKGKIVINPQFYYALNFKDGLARVIVGVKYGYIDKKGKIVINPQFDDAADFKDGLARVRVGGKHGFIDKKGKIVINPQFYDADDFKDGLARVIVGGKWGYIDKKGKIVINPQFDRAGNFNDGLAQVRVGGKWGYIDKKGKIVINPQFDDASNFKDGLAKVNVGEKRGYIDKKGKYVYNPQ